MKKKTFEEKIVDCECNGTTCCGGRGIAVFEVERNGKKMKVCTKCDLLSDKNKKILKYVKTISAKKLVDFDPLGAVCLADYIANGTYPFTR